MKVKTSITLSDYILKEIDKLLGNSGNRSIFIEHALIYYLEKKRRKTRDENDLEIINKNYNSLNHEVEDILSFQVDITWHYICN